jgi:HK97 family phage prohead protease
MTLERRATATPPEVRAGAGAAPVAHGYAALFNTQAEIGGYFVERIAPGTFAETIKSADVRALINHDSGRVIGRTKAGTLRLSEDATGLMAEIDLPDTTDGRDLAIQLSRGDISGMSFGFRVTREEWDETGDMPVRIIRAVDLIEVSAVAFPAYGDTSLAMRSLDEARKEQRRRNYNAAAARLQRKINLDLRIRQVGSKA